MSETKCKDAKCDNVADGRHGWCTTCTHLLDNVGAWEYYDDMSEDCPQCGMHVRECDCDDLQ